MVGMLGIPPQFKQRVLLNSLAQLQLQSADRAARFQRLSKLEAKVPEQVVQTPRKDASVLETKASVDEKYTTPKTKNAKVENAYITTPQPTPATPQESPISPQALSPVQETPVKPKEPSPAKSPIVAQPVGSPQTPNSRLINASATSPQEVIATPEKEVHDATPEKGPQTPVPATLQEEELPKSPAPTVHEEAPASPITTQAETPQPSSPALQAETSKSPETPQKNPSVPQEAPQVVVHVAQSPAKAPQEPEKKAVTPQPTKPGSFPSSLFACFFLKLVCVQAPRSRRDKVPSMPWPPVSYGSCWPARPMCRTAPP